VHDFVQHVGVFFHLPPVVQVTLEVAEMAEGAGEECADFRLQAQFKRLGAVLAGKMIVMTVLGYDPGDLGTPVFYRDGSADCVSSIY